MTPQVAVLPAYFRRETDEFGTGAITAAFRVVERGGSVLGPLIAGVVVATAGLEQAGRWIGYGVLVTTGLLTLLIASGVFRQRSR